MILSVLSVTFALMTYLGIWNDLRGDSLVTDTARRLSSINWSSDAIYIIRPGDKEWPSVIRIIQKYTAAKLPYETEAIELQEIAGGNLVLIYNHSNRRGVRVGLVRDLSDWARQDEAEFDFFSRNIIFGLLSATVGIFLMALRA